VSEATIWIAWLACSSEPCAQGYGRAHDGACVPLEGDPQDPDPGADSGPADTGTPAHATLEGPCEAADDLGDEPLTLRGTWQSEIQDDPFIFFEGSDVVFDAAAEQVLVVGVGGLVRLEVNADGAPTFVDNAVAYWEGRYDRIALGPAHVAVTHREHGIEILDLETLAVVSRIEEPGVTDVHWEGEALHAVFHDGRFGSWDVSAPDRPAARGAISSLGNPRALDVDGDVAWVADFELGLVTLDVAATPTVLHVADTLASPQDVSFGGDYLAVGAGSAGLQIFSLQDREAPVPSGSVDYHQAVLRVSAGSERAWGVGYEGVFVVDVTDPGSPLPRGSRATEQFAMAVAEASAHAVVADWMHVGVWDLDPEVLAPQVAVNRDVIYLTEGVSAFELEVANLRGSDLQLTGAGFDHPGWSATADTTRVPPGTHAQVTLSHHEGQADDTTFCLATNDPGLPTVTLPLTTTSTTQASMAVGETAPDFGLYDVDGGYHQLSDHLGQPILLAFFASW